MHSRLRALPALAAVSLCLATPADRVSAQDPAAAPGAPAGESVRASTGPGVRSVQVIPPEGLRWQHDAEFPELNRALLYGTQTEAEPYVYRLRAYAPARIPLHTHARTEYVTVLKGTLHHAPEGAARASARACGPGCFVVVPPGEGHQGWLEAGTVLQVHGVGPTEAHPRQGHPGPG
jgi:hypothetical protein